MPDTQNQEDRHAHAGRRDRPAENGSVSRTVVLPTGMAMTFSAGRSLCGESGWVPRRWRDGTLPTDLFDDLFGRSDRPGTV